LPQTKFIEAAPIKNAALKQVSLPTELKCVTIIGRTSAITLLSSTKRNVELRIERTTKAHFIPLISREVLRLLLLVFGANLVHSSDGGALGYVKGIFLLIQIIGSLFFLGPTAIVLYLIRGEAGDWATLPKKSTE
jgi:hypothetical protein